MKYDQAKALMAQHAPLLHLDEEGDHQHINVRKDKDGPPFSIMLFDGMDEPTFLDCLKAAQAHL